MLQSADGVLYPCRCLPHVGVVGQDRDTRVGSRHVRLVIPRQRRSRGRVGSALVLGLLHILYDPRFNRHWTGRFPEPQHR